MAAADDILIIGAGHNGLVCAAYLAAAGKSVRVLERRDVVGGAAVTEEFHPGFRNSTASYTVSLLNPRIIRDLRLVEHGLRVVNRPFSNFLPLPDGNYLRGGRDLADTQRQFARFSKRDASALPAYYQMLDAGAELLRSMILQPPPNLGGGLADVLGALKLGNRLRRLSLPEGRDVLDLFTKSAGEILDDWFDSEPVKALFGFDSVVGTFASPYSPGSAYVLLHHVFGESNGQAGQWGHAIGGMGAITQAMLKEVKQRGVQVEVDAPVAEVCIQDGRACGVILEDGRRLEARAVVANVHPQLLFTRLVDPEYLDEDFRNRIRRYRSGSGSFRMNVALSELPRFNAAPENEAQDILKSGIVIAPSLNYMEQAFFDARTSGYARQPIVEMLIPSTVDDTLAPSGAHVASLFCQQFNPNLPATTSWDELRDEAAETILNTVNDHAPNFKNSIVAMQVHSPLDLERKFGLIGGDIFHGALSLDQLFSARPVLGNAGYKAPIPGLYLCGSGTHPGGGVTGAPGHNAARVVIRELR